jgi:hypothetical protein
VPFSDIYICPFFSTKIHAFFWCESQRKNQEGLHMI